MKHNKWILFVVANVLLMGVWGAFIEAPEKNGFPATLGFCVWAFTMIPAAAIALKQKRAALETDRLSVLWGSLIGLLGAGGQLILFFVLRLAPAYLVFPLLALTPLVTILLAVAFLKEKTGLLGWLGIVIAIFAIFLLSYQPTGQSTGTSGFEWIGLTVLVLIFWGVQSFLMRFANARMQPESIFFYMCLSSLVMIPLALSMTDFSEQINWGWDGPGLAAVVQILNAFGALYLVYAFRYGKAIVVAPMTTALAPVLTVIISLVLHGVIPGLYVSAGIICAVISAVCLAIAENRDADLQLKK